MMIISLIWWESLVERTYNWFRFYSDVNGKDGETIPVEEKALIVPEQKEFLFSEFDWCVAVKVHTVHGTH